MAPGDDNNSFCFCGDAGSRGASPPQGEAALQLLCEEVL